MINNPLGLLTQMFGNNPQFNQIMELVWSKSPQELETFVRNQYKANKKDLKETAIQEAKKYNIDISNINF